MKYSEHFAQHLRLSVLQILNGAPAYRANSAVLHAAADALGLAASRDQVRQTLSWLEEAGLITAEDVGGLTVAQLAERGLDVAEGRARAPGVARPAPGAA